MGLFPHLFVSRVSGIQTTSRRKKKSYFSPGFILLKKRRRKLKIKNKPLCISPKVLGRSAAKKGRCTSLGVQTLDHWEMRAPSQGAGGHQTVLGSSSYSSMSKAEEISQ